MGFIDTYFLSPIRFEQGYSYYNTIAYALIAYLSLWSLNKLFNKTKMKIDVKFLLTLLPFIFIAAFLRVLVDKREIIRAAWNVSPGIYILITSIFLAHQPGRMQAMR